jgi:hypothetical protein
MKTTNWLSDPLSAVNGIAIVEVEPDEVADIDKMLALVDGDDVGHFGYSAEIMSIDEPPEIYMTKHHGKEAKQQFGFPNYSELLKHKRYYKFFVHRD